MLTDFHHALGRTLFWELFQHALEALLGLGEAGLDKKLVRLLEEFEKVAALEQWVIRIKHLVNAHGLVFALDPRAVDLAADKAALVHATIGVFGYEDLGPIVL